MSTLTKPPHESIVDAINRASEASVLGALGRLIVETTFLEGHDAIIEAYKRKLTQIPLSAMDLDLGVIYHLTLQRDALSTRL